MNRRTFLQTPAAWAAPADERRAPAWEQPVFPIRRLVKSPVTIARIELLRVGRNYFVRSTSPDGATGITLTKQLEAHLTKRRILELYLNVVELGPGIYGAQAAAEYDRVKLALEAMPWR